MADGDGRALLNLIEQVMRLEDRRARCPRRARQRLMQAGAKYDKSGDEHYNLISALHKSVRGSDPDAALYWFAGCWKAARTRASSPAASPGWRSRTSALPTRRRRPSACDAWETYERLGSPEGELALAQAVIYLALAPKSNAVYTAYKAARAAAETGSLMPPKHILNAPTSDDEGTGLWLGLCL
jgi:putative ATPase